MAEPVWLVFIILTHITVGFSTAILTGWESVYEVDRISKKDEEHEERSGLLL